MSKLAFIADIHGNLPALEATLRDIAKHNIKQIICLGDVATFGPQPTETLHRIQHISCPVIMGNGDYDLIQTQHLTAITDWLGEVSEWCRLQMSEHNKDFIRTFKPTITQEFEGLRILAYHGSPKSFNDSITATTPDEILENYFAGFQADVYVGGHTHEQFIRRYGAARVINPGSVGLPFVMKDQQGFNLCVAEYAILEVINNEPNVTFRRIRYDLKHLEKVAKECGMPHAQHWLNWL